VARANGPMEITRAFGESVGSVTLIPVGRGHVAVTFQNVAAARPADEMAQQLISQLTASERRSAALAAELRRANATLQTLIDTMPTGVVACDASGRIILANPAVREFVGGEVYERLREATDVYSVHHIDGSLFAPVEYPLLRTLQEQTTIRDVEMEIRRRDGTTRVLLISASPVLDANGELIGAIAVSRDITGRKIAEEALKENEERFRLLYERAPLGYQSLDEAGRVIDVNLTWVDTLGFDREDMMGRPFEDFLAPEQSQSFRDEFARLKDTGESRDAEFEMVRRDGTRLMVAFIGRVSYDEQGRFRQAHCILNDVTEQKRLEEQLLRASRLEMAGRIAGQVAHDLNNLLAPLVAYPELMRMQLPPDHPFQEYCETMLRSGQQISTISTNLLALGRRGHFNQETLDLNRLVQQVIDQMTDRPETLSLIPELSEDLLPIVGSAAQLVRVIVNLVANAREAMLDDGSLALRTANVYLDRPFGRLNRVAVGEYVRLEVADNGPGIPPDVVSRMFEPFFSSKRADDQRGSGLGLSIVEAVVNDHRGYVDVETKAGAGTTFSLYFPAARGAVLAAEIDLVGGQGESILLVDDDATQREVIGRLLRQLNYRVGVAARADEALSALRAEPVDLLLLDMVMPGIDGAELYKRALALRPGTPAILVSGFAESRRVRLARELGAVNFLQKPLTLGKLARAVRAALDAQREGSSPG
jgi:two-component system, cell cycle sensor histidine kinase and response regulator CckA